jgi:hypothetical protein
MKNTHSPSSDTFPNEVKVNLNMLGALMLHRVCREVDSNHIVTVDDCSTL